MDQSKKNPAADTARSNRSGPAHNVIDTAIGAGQFKNFAACVLAAELSGALSGTGPFTVFAPTDAAFAKLPVAASEALLKNPARLMAILKYHVVQGFVTSRDLKSGDIMTLQGSKLTALVSTAGIEVNGAHVTQADLVATNGVIHAIDTVILPKGWQLVAAAA